MLGGMALRWGCGPRGKKRSDREMEKEKEEEKRRDEEAGRAGLWDHKRLEHQRDA